MKSVLRALVLAFLTFPALVHAATSVSQTFAFDDAVVDPSTGTIPGRVVITNSGTESLATIVLTLESVERLGEPTGIRNGGLTGRGGGARRRGRARGGGTVSDDADFACSGGGPRLQCVHGALEPQASIAVEVRFRLPEGGGRTRVRAGATGGAPARGGPAGRVCGAGAGRWGRRRRSRSRCVFVCRRASGARASARA